MKVRLCLSILIFFIAAAMLAHSAKIEKIAVLTVGGDNPDFDMPRGSIASTYDLPIHLIPPPDGGLWVTDGARSKIRAYNANGELAGDFDWPNKGRSRDNIHILGFGQDNVCYISYGLQISKTPEFPVIKWNITKGLGDTISLDWSMVLKEIQVSELSLSPLTGWPALRFNGGYFIGAMQDQPSYVWDSSGRYLGKIPFHYWSAAGVGASIHYHRGISNEDIFSFYITPAGECSDSIVKTLDLDSPWESTFLGFDEAGRAYFSRFLAAAEKIQMILVRFDALHDRREWWHHSFVADTEMNGPDLTGDAFSPKGIIFFAGVEPSWQTRMALQERRDRGEDLPAELLIRKVHIWKCTLDDEGWKPLYPSKPLNHGMEKDK